MTVAPIDKGAFIEKITNSDQAPRFEDWKVINAQALVVGRTSGLDGGHGSSIARARRAVVKRDAPAAQRDRGVV